MASYESIPAAEDGLLLETPKPKTNSLKGLVAGAAITSFVLGIVAATAVTQHAVARQTNLKTTAAGLVNRAYSTPAGEENCGGQWGFALAFGRKDAKNQCPPGESAPPPPLSPFSLSLSLCLLIPNRDTLFWCAGSQCDKTSNTCVPSVPKTTGVPGVVESIANQVSARATRRVQALEERRR